MALLAFLGFRSLPSSSLPANSSATKEPPPQTKEQKTATPNTDDAAASADFTQPLRDFYGTALKSHESGFPYVPGWNLEFLVATAPDPVQSSSGYRFDSLVDSIQRAAETSGYVLDRYWYPWPQHGGRTGADEANSATSLAGRQKPSASKGSRKEPSRENLFERQPGMLLFRGNPEDANHQLSATNPVRLLAVLLVGETATAGIHKEAFAAAVHLIDSGDRRFPDPIPVLGPYFSGSQTSLAAALREQRPTRRFQVITGSASGYNRRPLVDEFGEATGFHSTVVPSHIIMEEMLNRVGLLDANGLPRERIAVLVESNTGFGEQGASPYLLQGRSHFLQMKDADYLFFPFPLHVSEVRTEYQRVDDSQKGPVLTLPSFGSKLRLPSDDNPGARDTEPSFHPGMAAVIGERMLAGTLTALAHEHIRTVVILATEVKDRIFLAGLVRQYDPEARLLVVGGDILYSHPDNLSAMRGALVGSTYPLYPRNQRWSLPFARGQRTLLFSGDVDQGYYNAAIALLSRNHAERLRSLYEYGTPFVAMPPWRSRPPVWLSVITQTGLQPLAAVDPLAALQQPAKAENAHWRDTALEYRDYVWGAWWPMGANGNPVFDIRHSALWIMPFLAFNGLIAYLLLITARQKTRKWTEPSKKSRKLFLLAEFAPLAVIYVFLTAIVCIPALDWLRWGDGLVHLSPWNSALVVALCMLVAAVKTLGRCFRPIQAEHPAPRGRAPPDADDHRERTEAAANSRGLDRRRQASAERCPRPSSPRLYPPAGGSRRASLASASHNFRVEPAARRFASLV